MQHRSRWTPSRRSPRIPTSASSGGCWATSFAIMSGDALFRRIEYIRATSVDRHRGIATAAVDAGLGALTLDDTLAFVRGFMLFSMLANLAEDRRGLAAEPGADVASAIERLAEQGVGSERGAGAAGARADRAGADRSPDRSPPQVDHRPSQPGRRPDEAARRRAGGDAGGRAGRGGDPPADRLALADPAAPARAALRRRRGGERARLSARRLPAGDPGACRRAGNGRSARGRPAS